MSKFKLRSPELSEAGLKYQITQYLGLLENQRKLLFIRNNSFKGKVIRADGSEGWLTTGSPGATDLLLLLPKGLLIQVELKRRSGRVGELQEAWKAKSEKLGHPYLVIRSLDQLIGILKQYSVV